MNPNTIKFLKVREVISPSRAYPTDAGIDFFVPAFTPGFVEALTFRNEKAFEFFYDEEKNLDFFNLNPQQGVKIPSGLHCKMSSPGRMLRAANKSGVATKYLLDITAEIVDYSYQGEVHIAIKNDSSEPVRIYENMKIVQFIEMPIFTSEVKVEENEYPEIWYVQKSDRSDGGFGSTNI